MWTKDDRATALAAYYKTGSRRQARRITGVPERTLSEWLSKDKYDEERIPVCTGAVRLDLDGPYELARFMKSLNKAFDRFLRDEFGGPE